FEDKDLVSGKYKYRLKQTDYNGNFEYFNLTEEVVIGIPDKFSLGQNYPNPFNPVTKISYEIPYDSKVSLKIFDISGREIRTLVDEYKAAGYYTIDLNASGLASGIYFYRISAEGNGNSFTAVKKMMVLK
ncbi:MAG TPA: T9SS type A sorting domain-containing protein, partial [Ignavibacteria bacterium]|nr:T9SS type A sorting domain-containing protein [Ignavibacteria bacterium]HMR41344.1 T9SS type A sorting domain-containing protein [Ignavibacteria bacterium]